MEGPPIYYLGLSEALVWTVFSKGWADGVLVVSTPDGYLQLIF